MVQENWTVKVNNYLCFGLIRAFCGMPNAWSDEAEVKVMFFGPGIEAGTTKPEGWWMICETNPHFLLQSFIPPENLSPPHSNYRGNSVGSELFSMKESIPAHGNTKQLMV